MDPLSVTAGVVGLVATSSKVIVALKGFVDASHGATSRIHLVIAEVELFKRTLQSMNETLDTDEVRPMFQSTGHLSAHWNNIITCLDDGQKMLHDFESMLSKIDKNAYFMNTARKTLRLKEATEDIYAFQQQFRCYRDTIQLSLQAALLWNQMTAREHTNTSRDLPDLSELTRSINRLAHEVSGHMTSLENTAQVDEISDKLSTLVNLRNCVQSSAKVASSASSMALTLDGTESIATASDLYGIFDSKPDPETVAWVTTTSKLNLTIQEHEAPSLAEWFSAPVISVSTADDSDYEEEIEAELANLHIRQGRTHLEKGDYAMAEQELGQGLRRLRRPKSRQQNDHVQAEGLEGLAQIYRQQERWQEAKETITERLSLLSRTATAHSTDVLDERLSLAKVLLKLKDPVEARLHVRACIVAYKKLGVQGVSGLEQSYHTMREICVQDGDADGQRDYTMLLTSLTQTNRPLDEVSREMGTSDRLEASQNTQRKEHQKPTDILSTRDSIGLDGMFSYHDDTSLGNELVSQPTKDFGASFFERSVLKNLEDDQVPMGRRTIWDNANVTNSWSTAGDCDQLKAHEAALVQPNTQMPKSDSREKKESGLLSTVKRSKSTQHHHNNPDARTHQRSVSNPEPASREAVLLSSLDQESTAISDEENTNSGIGSRIPLDRASCSGSAFSWEQSLGTTQDTSFHRIEPPSQSMTALPRVRALFVGHSCSGKTSLISRCLHGPESTLGSHEFTPTLMPHVTNYMMDNKSTSATELVLWDSPGPMNESLFPSSIHHIATGISCIVLCFAVDDPDLVSDIDTLWAPRIHEVFPGKPVILVGTKVDLRSIQRGLVNRTATMSQPCDTREGLQIQDRIGAVTYLDCSAKTGEGIQDLKKEISIQGMRYKELTEDSGRLKGIWRRSRGWLNWKT